ncbi:TIGR03943 family putative permease subunit [Tepidiforma thermophila]|uniref:Putative repeat protein (TIGR03943 family) n=1 Tax=Tepidiforma thermophila (strain KCTC 52669 / CGMCC 1.13589 / G233) TaxID=2761530 RepID=A0A2A9HC25_TEPT2|nr:TIGR03943 family protein [Tepidiforma thermophila]PFG73547.1 putative repeat protein (TIGR03943 family) [Tepidiforma thermophila]
MVRDAGYALAAAALGLLIAWRLFDGTARNLVQGWYVPILAATALLLLAAAAVALAAAVREGPPRWRRPTAAGAVAAAAISLPLIVAAAFEPRPLASSNLNLSAASARQFSASASAADPARRNIYQWAYEFETADPAAIAGQPVEVIGFVFRRDGDPPERFRVARFVVACCIADAQGFTLPVLWKDASTLANDQWVRVTGRVGIGPGGEPIVLAASVDPIEAPQNPYIYP